MRSPAVRCGGPVGAARTTAAVTGMGPIVAITHGHEAAWASTPGARSVMRSIGDSVDTVTYLGEYTVRGSPRPFGHRQQPGCADWCPGGRPDIPSAGAGRGCAGA